MTHTKFSCGAVPVINFIARILVLAVEKRAPSAANLGAADLGAADIGPPRSHFGTKIPRREPGRIQSVTKLKIEGTFWARSFRRAQHLVMNSEIPRVS
jgi:hypothetical protein